jgi:epsin
LAMSREEAEQEEQRRRSDDVRLQLALSQSQQDFKTPQSEKQSHMLDLLDVNLGEASGSSVQTDPWGIPIAAPPPRPQPQNDPWSVPTTSTTSSAVDPWTPVPPQRPRSSAATIDPWRAPAPSPATVVSPPRTNDPWSPVPSTAAATTTTTTESETNKLQAAQDGITSSSFNNSNLTHNIGFAVSTPQNIGFNLPPGSSTTTFNTSNGFNGTGPGFNNFPTQNNNNAAATSPLSDLDEFDVITNRGKLGASPQTVNNGSTTSSGGDPFDLGGIADTLPANGGAVKKTPQSFLGENSALVNLDNLVSASAMKPSAPAPTATMSYTANPFATVTPPPRPSINQIRQDPWTANTTTTANPFLS